MKCPDGFVPDEHQTCVHIASSRSSLNLVVIVVPILVVVLLVLAVVLARCRLRSNFKEIETQLLQRLTTTEAEGKAVVLFCFVFFLFWMGKPLSHTSNFVVCAC